MYHASMENLKILKKNTRIALWQGSEINEKKKKNSALENGFFATFLTFCNLGAPRMDSKDARPASQHKESWGEENENHSSANFEALLS